jgi:hypothetical protein
MEPYTEEQMTRNYEVLLQSIQTMRTGRITEDWMEDHKRQIWIYWNWFSNLSNFEPDNGDVQFRAVASTGEVLLNRLVSQIKEHGTFHPHEYLQFCENINFMIDYYQDCSELADFMTKINLQ